MPEQSAEASLAAYLRNVADKLESGRYCNHDAWTDLTKRSPYSEVEPDAGETATECPSCGSASIGRGEILKDGEETVEWYNCRVCPHSWIPGGEENSA